MIPKSLFLNNKKYTYAQIKSGEYQTKTLFEKETLLFCQQWLNGKKEFEQKTSGSTGKPKTIKISRAQMQLSAKLTVNALKLITNYTALICIDTAFIGGKMMLVRALEHHFWLIIKKPSSNPFKNINEQIDFVAMVPLQMLNTINNNPEKIKKCRAIILGGAPVHKTLSAKIANLKTPIYSTYGMTETVSHIALQKISFPAENAFKTIGKIKLNVNANNQLIITGAITNHQKLITNDKVELLSPTTFKWLGRASNVINSGGIKIQTEIVEEKIFNILKFIKFNHRFFIIGVPDELLGQKILLCIEAKKENTPPNLLELLNSKLEKYKRIKEIVYINRFLETYSGKVLRKESWNLSNIKKTHKKNG